MSPPDSIGSPPTTEPRGVTAPYPLDSVDDLSPLLKQGRAIEPLVIAIAFLALLPPLSLASPDVEGSAWMLRAVSVVNSGSLSDWLIPGGRENLPTHFLPPGVTWIQALVLECVGVQYYWHLPILSYLAGACGIWWSWRLVRLLADSRMALLTVVMLSVHGQLLRIAGSASPWAISWALTIATLLLLSLHLKKSNSYWSWRLLAAGGTLSAGVLCGGLSPLALVIPVGLACWMLHVASPATPEQKASLTPTMSWRGVVGTALVVLVAALASGWWTGLIIIQGGWAALESWLTGQWIHADSTAELLNLDDFMASSARLRADRTWLVWSAPLVGWQILGTLVLITWKEHRWPESMTQFVRPWLIMTIAIGFAGWGFVELQGQEQQLSLTMWQTTLLFTTTLLAVIGLESILRRETRGRALALLAIMTAMCCVWGIYQNRHIRFSFATASLFLLFFAVASGLTWWRTIQLNQEAQRRRVIKAVVGSLLAIQFVWGYLMLERPQADVRCLRNFTEVLQSAPRAESVCIISSQGIAPPQIELAVRAAQPRAHVAIHSEACEFPEGSPKATHLVIEWSRRDRKGGFSGPAGHVIESIGEPLRFRGRRLLIWQVRPQAGISQARRE